MKTFHHQLGKLPRGRIAAFSLIEMLVGNATFLSVFTGVMVGLQVFALRVHTLAATKLCATADSRKTLNALREQIRASKIVYVGTYNLGTFSRITNGLPQTGNALEIYFSDTNNMPSGVPVIYYQVSSGSTNALYRVSNNIANQFANYVTNYYVFTAEDYQANTLTSYNNNSDIRITLQFTQWEYPISYIGTNGLNEYNFYRLQTRVSRRAKD